MSRSLAPSHVFLHSQCMSRALIDSFCTSLAGATASDPTTELDSWKVGGKMFACFGSKDGGQGVSVKTDHVDTAALLIDAGAAVRAPYFHKSGGRLPFDTTAHDEMRHRVIVSYDIIRKSLPKALRAGLAARQEG